MAEAGRGDPGPSPLRTRTTTKLRVYLALAALGALAGLVFGAPALVAVTAPLAVYVAAGLSAAARPPRLEVMPVAIAERLYEGAEFELEVGVRLIGAPAARAEFELAPGPGLRAAADHAGRPVRIVTTLTAGEIRALHFPLRAERWGAPRAGVLAARCRDRLGVLEHELTAHELPRIGVRPRAETLRELVDPSSLRASFGSRVSRGRGDGIEAAEIRAFHPGDAVRRINWRVSARRGELHVSDRHPERSADVVLLLDTFSDIGEGGEGGEGTLALAVRAALALAAGYHARADRVGVIGFGGVLTGLGARLGSAQLERIVDVLIASEVSASYAAKRVSVIPRRLLPPRALVVALTPLIDERSVAALFDLHRRGFDLMILELSPEPFVSAARGAAPALAERLWRLRHEALRARLRALGVTVVTWDGREPLALPVLAAAHGRRGRRVA